MKLHLILLVLPLVIGENEDFPSPKVHCFDPDATTAIDTTRKWKNTGGDQSKGLCFDTEGLAYNVDALEDECCGCLHYRCSTGYCEDPGNLPYNYSKWILSHVDKSCCQDCSGAVYPQNEIVKKTKLDDECETVKTDICKNEESGYADDSTEESTNRKTSKVVTTFEVLGCCIDSDGISPLNTSKLNLQTCSVRRCTDGRPSVWVDKPVYPGQCDCCKFEDNMVQPGFTKAVNKHFLAVCREGEILYRKRGTEEEGGEGVGGGGEGEGGGEGGGGGGGPDPTTKTKKTTTTSTTTSTTTTKTTTTSTTTSTAITTTSTTTTTTSATTSTTTTTTSTTTTTTSTTTTTPNKSAGQCSEPYTELKEVWRKVNYTPGGATQCDPLHCDRKLKGWYESEFTAGWYRFVEPAGVSLPMAPPVMSGKRDPCEVCQTKGSAWISERRHPTVGEDVMDVTFYFAWHGMENLSDGLSTKGQVVACQDQDNQVFYLYKLAPVKDCELAYCAIGA